MKLKIVTPTGIIFDGEAKMLSVMGSEGSLSVMNGHIPFVTCTKAGVFRIYDNGGNITEYNAGEGMLTVEKDVILLVENAEKM